MDISLLKLCAVAMTSALMSLGAWAQSVDGGCSNLTLSGAYAFRISGQILPPGGAPLQREGIALTQFDGAGKLTQVDFIMANGNPTSGPADPVSGFHTGETGWYKVNSDCTGTAEIVFPAPPGINSGAVVDLMLVVSNHGRTIHTIVSRLLPPGSTTPVPVSIHSDAEKLGDTQQ